MSKKNCNFVAYFKQMIDSHHIEKTGKHIIGILALFVLAAHMLVSAGVHVSHFVPTTPRSNSAEQTLSIPMAATLVLDRIDVSCPTSSTISFNRSRRPVTQWTQPTSLLGVLWFSNLLTSDIKGQLHIVKGLLINFPSEKIPFPFHVFW